MNDNLNLVRVKEASSLLGVSRATVIKLIEDGKISAFKMRETGKACAGIAPSTSPWLIFRESLDRFLKKVLEKRDSH